MAVIVQGTTPRMPLYFTEVGNVNNPVANPTNISLRLSRDCNEPYAIATSRIVQIPPNTDGRFFYTPTTADTSVLGSLEEICTATGCGRIQQRHQVVDAATYARMVEACEEALEKAVDPAQFSRLPISNPNYKEMMWHVYQRIAANEYEIDRNNNLMIIRNFSGLESDIAYTRQLVLAPGKLIVRKPM